MTLTSNALAGVLLAMSFIVGVSDRQAGSVQPVGERRALRGEFAGSPHPESQLPRLAMKFQKDGRWIAEGGEATWTVGEIKGTEDAGSRSHCGHG